MPDLTADLTPANAAPADPASATTTTTPAGQAPAAAPPAGQAPADPERIEDLPPFAQKIIRDLRAENEKRRKTADDDKRKAEEERLATEKKWQELAEKRGTELETLKAIQAKYDELATAARTRIRTEIEKWPAEVKALAPADNAEIAEWETWADKARKLVQVVTNGAQTPPAGQGATPKPAGQGSRVDAERAAKVQAQVTSRF